MARYEGTGTPGHSRRTINVIPHPITTAPAKVRRRAPTGDPVVVSGDSGGRGRRCRQLEARRRAPDNRRRRYPVLGWFFVIAGTFDTVRGYVTADGDVSVEDADEDEEML